MAIDNKQMVSFDSVIVYNSGIEKVEKGKLSFLTDYGSFLLISNGKAKVAFFGDEIEKTFSFENEALIFVRRWYELDFAFLEKRN